VLIRRITTHSLQAIAEGALIAMLVVGLMAGTAFAGKGGGKPSGGNTSGGGTISLRLMNGDTEPIFGHTVTFALSTTATAYPYVHLRCFRGGSLVLESWQGFFSTAIGHPWLTLGPSNSWSGGDADCTANLEKATSKGSWSVLAATSFHVFG
jgi:hypothetical protein